MATVMTLSGCTQQKDAMSILANSYDKLDYLETYNITYHMIIEGSPIGTTLNMESFTEIAKYGEYTRALITMKDYLSAGVDYEFENYEIPEGIVSCVKTMASDRNEYACLEADSESITIFDPSSRGMHRDFDELKKYIDDGALVMTYEGEEKIIGRSCQSFLFEVDFDVLSKTDENFAVSGFDLETMIPTYSIEYCFDNQYGIPLKMRVDITVIATEPEENGSLKQASMSSYFTATDFNLNVNRDVLDLPIPYEEVQWIQK